MMPSALVLLIQAATPVPAPTTVATSVGSMVCLTRTIRDHRDAVRPLTVAVRAGTVPTLLGSGFSVAPCATIGRTARQYRAEACALAQSGNSAVQARLATVLGVKPALLCSEATVVESTLAATMQSAD